MKIPGNVRSIAVVGMQKNTGKTETLNWLLRQRLHEGCVSGLTSIGIDGETTDQVTLTAKPEIEIAAGTLFVTSEQHFRCKSFAAEILALSEQRTALGRLVTARACGSGKIMLSGPPYTIWLKKCIEELLFYGADKVFVDGALFRLSPASPSVTDGVVLATGAALTLNYGELIKKTVHTVQLMQLPLAETRELWRQSEGLWALLETREVVRLVSHTALAFDKSDIEVLKKSLTVYLAGSISDGFLTVLLNNRCFPEIVVRDFTRVFAGPEKLARYLASGGALSVIEQSELLAVTVNPWAPSGYELDDARIIEALRARISVPVINIRKDQQCQN